MTNRDSVLLGLIPEPPYSSRSWSGSAAHFFHALRTVGVTADAAHVQLGPTAELAHKIRAFSPNLSRWRARYHASVPRFVALSSAAQRIAADHPEVDGTIQVGCWFCAASDRTRAAFSYHDGNAALWYRHYGRGLLSAGDVEKHLLWERRTYEKMDRIFVMSKWLASSFVEDFGVQPNKLCVVGAGINFTDLPIVPSRDFHDPHFLFVGRDFDRKGGRYLLESFAQLRKWKPNARLTIVGPNIKQGPDGVTYAGFLNKADPDQCERLETLYRTATTFILPSVYEPFGIALAEAMSWGLPCIAVNRCAMPEIVEHAVTGLIAAPEDSVSLAKAMLALASSPKVANDMGLAGRKRVEQKFTWHHVANKIKNQIGL